MAETWPTVVGSTSTRPAQIKANVALGRSGAMLRAMPHTALATTATATTFRPCNHPPADRASRAVITSAKRIMATAEGRVNPAQASNPPRMPRNEAPNAIPTWLLAGPGRNWLNDTRSA